MKDALSHGKIAAAAVCAGLLLLSQSSCKGAGTALNGENTPSGTEGGRIGTVAGGTEYYGDFLLDNVLFFADGTEELHYHIYIPEQYDGTAPYALYISLPGYAGYYFQGVGANLKTERFAEASKTYVQDMIVVAPQPNDWGETSAKQAVGLTKYLLDSYNIDTGRVYISGYSGGGETLSLVLEMQPELYTAALHVSSQWDGSFEPLVRSRTPLCLVIGESDEYYGAEPARQAYQTLRSLYEKEAQLTAEEVDRVLALEIKPQSYFTQRGCSSQHGGGEWISQDKKSMGWLFSQQRTEMRPYTEATTVKEVLEDPAFSGFGRLLFPLGRSVSGDMTLAELSSRDIYVWYSYIRPEKTVEILNHLKRRADSGLPIFYSIYSPQEVRDDPSKADTGLFYFGGEEGQPFAIVNAGGGFLYVGAMHDSFPHALELSRRGYNGFALIYRPDDPYSDLARAIEYIHDHAGELGVDGARYSLWGGSAGARMAAVLGNGEELFRLTGRTDIPRADAVIMQYTGYQAVSDADAPAYACVGTSDGIASWRVMQARLAALSDLGIPTEFHAYDGLPHGFGLGVDTAAEGWLDDAVAFWREQIDNRV